MNPENHVFLRFRKKRRNIIQFRAIFSDSYTKIFILLNPIVKTSFLSDSCHAHNGFACPGVCISGGFCISA